MADEIIKMPDAYPHQLEILGWDDAIKFHVAAIPARGGKGFTGGEKVSIRTAKYHSIWANRDYQIHHPRWLVWCVAPTYSLAEQQWLDVQAFLPKKYWGGNPTRPPNMTMPLCDKGLIEFKSASHPEMLVSKPVDYLWITEAREIKRSVWGLLRQRLMSPERVKYSGAFIEGTPGPTDDPDDPKRLHWFYEMILSGRGENRNPEYKSFYWFEDKCNFSFLDHPILSRTPEGRKEIESQRNDPMVSPREFEMGVLGKFLPGREGKVAVVGFMPEIHIDPQLDYDPRHILYRAWDFSRNYPACTFHQIASDGCWNILAECVPLLEDLLDIEFGTKVKNMTEKLFPDVKSELIYDHGDFEATHKEDSRRETTKQAFKTVLGIDLIVKPTESGDEQLAIDIFNARMKLGNDRKPHFRIHPRCELVIKCLEGDWVLESRKVGAGDSIEYRESISEVHPFIDIFDTAKYFIVRVLNPLLVKQYKSDRTNKRHFTPTAYDKVTGRPLN